MLIPVRDNDGNWVFTLRKSYRDTSKSFTSTDFSDRKTWFFDYTRVPDEVMSTADNIVYSSTRTPKAGWNHSWIDWREIPNHKRQSDPTNMRTVVKKNDVVITDGFTIDYDNGTVTFSAANAPTDVIKVSYSYGNSSKFDLMSTPGKRLRLDYVEVQISKDAVMPENNFLMFQSIYNGPAIPPDALGPGHPGLPANTDIVLRTFEYHGFRDFINESTQAKICLPTLNMTKEAVILPWDYLTGHTIVPVGTPADLSVGEFHKLRCVMDHDDTIIGNCDLATGTFYCMVENM